MEFTDRDFEGLPYPVVQFDKNHDIFALFPIFGKYDAYLQDPGEGLNINWVIRYIILCFSKGSPIVTQIDDVFEQRYKAAQIAGFPHDDKDRYTEAVENMIRSKNKVVNSMIFQYCVSNDGEDFATMVAYRAGFRIQLEKFQNLTAEEKSKESSKALIETIESLRANITKLRSGIFLAEKDSLLRHDIYAFMEARQLKLMPEDYAKLLEPNEFLIDANS